MSDSTVDAPMDEPLALEVPTAVEIESAEKKKGFGIGAWLATGWLTILVFAATFADFLPLNDPADEVAQKRLAPFQSGGPLLGADANGRDMLARTIYGARTSLIIAVCAILLGLIVGGVLGLLAGYFRNWLGNSLVRGEEIAA